MRRTVLALAAALMALALGAPAALAHPLGNFSINHLTQVSVSRDRVDLRYLLDEAEIPTFQQRGTPDQEVLAQRRAEVQRGLTVTVDGRQLAVQALPGGLISHPPGQGGLPLTRVEIPLRVSVRDARHVELHDATFPDRVGWKAVVPRPGDGTTVRASVTATDPTDGLRHYPESMLTSPLNERSGRFDASAGDGTVIAPPLKGGKPVATTNRSGDGFAGVFADAAAGRGVLIFLLLAAFAWGAIHALSPGHGKAMVAAYLVGTRGTTRHAVALGAVTTLTHTIGVFALGVVTLLLSQFILPEQLYPWLNLASGVLVLVIGVSVLRSRVRWYRARRAGVPPGVDHAHGHSHEHDHAHDHSHSPDGHSHSHGDGHHHHVPETMSWKGLVALGASAGLIPCPSALVVLLGAIAQHQVPLGLLLIAVFSLGLATTLTGLGLAVVHAGRLTERVDFSGRVAAALPAISAVVIFGAGCLLTLRAVPQLA